MTLYEINIEIEDLLNHAFAVDEETGELVADPDFETKLESLQMNRETKLESIGVVIKNMVAEAKALREEEKNLAERRRRAEKKTEWLKEYLADNLQGEKFSTPKVAISFRKSKSVEVDPEFVPWAYDNRTDLLTVKVTENKTAIRDAIRTEELPYCRMVDNLSIQIK